MSKTVPSKCLQPAPNGSYWAWPSVDPMQTVPDELWPAVARSCQSIFLNVVWEKMQPTATSPLDPWHLLQFSKLVDKARSYGLEVLVGTTAETPAWLPMKDWLPVDLGPESPWGIFQTTIAKLVKGRARWIVPFNEANGRAPRPSGEQLAWAGREADKTFATVPGRPGLLMPALLDEPDMIPLLTVMLRTLRDERWKPECEVGLCVHNYRLKITETGVIVALAKHYEWAGQPGIWYTEQAQYEEMQPVGDPSANRWQLPQPGQLADQLLEKDFWEACVEYNKKLPAGDEWTINLGTHYQLTWSGGSWFTGLYVRDDGPWLPTPLGEWWVGSKRFA